MNGAFYIGATGLHAQQRALDVTANNIANLNTHGFKRSQVSFSEVLNASAFRDIEGSSSMTAPGGVAIADPVRVFSSGEMKSTGRSDDLAIAGRGFIELVGQDGQILLWRGGRLTINSDGFLAADDGMPLRSMISVPAGQAEVTIDANGRVTSADGSELGHIELALVADETRLQSLGGGVYAAELATIMGAVPGEEHVGLLLQGAIELSNVQLTDEMVTLLLLQRAYAANAQVIQAGDQLMGIVNSLRR